MFGFRVSGRCCHYQLCNVCACAGRGCCALRGCLYFPILLHAVGGGFSRVVLMGGYTRTSLYFSVSLGAVAKFSWASGLFGINQSFDLLYGYGTLGLGLAFSFLGLLWAKWKDAKRDTQINTTTTFFHNKRTQRATQLTPFSSICESTALRIGKRQNIWLLEREGAVPSLAYSGVERAAN